MRDDGNHPLDGRRLAARVLLRVLRDGAFASASLNAEIERYPQLAPRERAFGTELVYGTLRTYESLLDLLERGASRGLPRKDLHFTVPLAIAAYQIVLLERVPAFAAVDQAVGEIRARRGPGLAGLANALLRKLAGMSFDRAELIYRNVPPWLREALATAVGEEQARALLGAQQDQSGEGALTCIRTRAGHFPPGDLEWKRSPWLADAYRLAHAGDPRRHPDYSAGGFVIQEEGAQFLAAALGARPHDRVWDACAGRGQKTLWLADHLGPNPALFASDLHPGKLAALTREFSRLGLGSVRTEALDLTLGTGDLAPGFDRILVDAPCTGTGTLRRRPELLRRLGPEDPERLSKLAAAIVRNAARLLGPRGKLVFAVCSVLQDECEGLLTRVRDDLEPTPFDAPEVTAVFGEVTSFRMLPGIHGTDGYFAACLRRPQKD